LLQQYLVSETVVVSLCDYINSCYIIVRLHKHGCYIIIWLRKQSCFIIVWLQKQLFYHYLASEAELLFHCMTSITIWLKKQSVISLYDFRKCCFITPCIWLQKQNCYIIVRLQKQSCYIIWLQNTVIININNLLRRFTWKFKYNLLCIQMVRVFLWRWIMIHGCKLGRIINVNQSSHRLVVSSRFETYCIACTRPKLAVSHVYIVPRMLSDLQACFHIV